MDLLGPYHETEKGSQFALTVVWLLTNYIFMIPMRWKTTEELIKPYLTGVYSTFGSNKNLWSDREGKFTSKQFTWLARELGFIKVYILPDTPTCNSVIKWTLAFLKASLRKLICNHNIDWDEIAHIATMVHNVCLHSSSGEAPFYLMFGHNTFMPTSFKLLLPKLRYMGDEKCRIHLDAREGNLHDTHVKP